MFLPPQGIFTSTVLSSGYTGTDEAVVDVVKVFGLSGKPSYVQFNGTDLTQSEYSYKVCVCSAMQFCYYHNCNPIF